MSDSAKNPVVNCYEFPKFFGTRLINNLKRLHITPYMLLYEPRLVDPIISAANSGIGVNSLFKVTNYRLRFFSGMYEELTE